MRSENQSRFHFILIVKSLIGITILLAPFSLPQSPNSWLNLDTIKAGKFDTGKMWTFDYPPSDYFEEQYNFMPDGEWYDRVRMSALKFANYCSASFVSEDGLIMTNHHCARESITEVTLEDENLQETGFIALTPEDERPVPGLYVDQLIKIEDVTTEIHSALAEAESEDVKIEIEYSKIAEIEERYSSGENTYAIVVSLYNGGKYSLYLYKRYNDVRLVFAPEAQAGYFGGDFDNFTYPRYNLDCSFFRVYDEDGNPLKSEHYFKWSSEGAKTGETVFVVGNPASTNRLRTVSQLEYNRDIMYPRTIELIEKLIDAFENLIEENPDRKIDLNDQLLNYYNSLKAYKGMLRGLRDPVLMQKKKDFESSLKSAVLSDTGLSERYGNLWSKIDSLRMELKKITNLRFALSTDGITAPAYFLIAEELVTVADEMKLPEVERSGQYEGEELNNYLESLIPEDYNSGLDRKLLNNKIEMLYDYLGEDDGLILKITGGKKGYEAVEFMLAASVITSFDEIKELVEKGPEAILSSDDPFIYFVLNTRNLREELDVKFDRILTEEEAYNQQLGRLVFEVYGTSIPPDATFTLRISDGVVAGFPYNGTVAPPVTTFYGLLDRYYSYNGEFPWTLDEIWLNPPPEFDLSTPVNFVLTADVTGGASGSPVINKNAEIVGLAFDGNIQSLPGDFIYQPDENRTVAVHSEGILEAIRDLYRFDRLADELESGRCCE